jgi:hypothetical protein
MPKTQVNCPRCRQPVYVEVEQLFDLNQDSLAKQKLLNGAVNFLQCPSCGYQGSLATPVVYHDPEKELLLTYYPAELNASLSQQEQQIGPLINRVMTNMPQEKRKAYLLQPKAMFTYQTLIEKILESDGITKEMLDAQQKRIELLQRLIATPQDSLITVIQQEESLIDIEFFTILSRVMQSAESQPDAKVKESLNFVQKTLFEHTKIGKKLYEQTKNTESVQKALQAVGKDGLTREKLLDIVLNAENDAQLSVLVGFARSGFDYQFFQILSSKIEVALDTEKQRLSDIRQKLLDFCDLIDQQIATRFEDVKNKLENILSSNNIEETIQKNLDSIDELFIQVVEQELSSSRQKADLDRISKLERILVVIEKMSAPPAEVKLLEDLLQYSDESDLDQRIEKAKSELTPQFIEILNSVLAQNDAEGKNAVLREKLRVVNKAVLRFVMKQNLAK